jgi:hypothetical protein
VRISNRFAIHAGDATWTFVVLTLLMLPASGRRADAKSHEVPIRDLRIAALPAGAAGSARLLREIDDPSSGTRWLLVRDQANPGGPGRIELAPPGRDPGVPGRQAKAARGPQTKPVLIIRAGDKVVVEEHSATTDAYLEGLALGPAGPGSALNVRLSIGGRVVRAVAVAPGRAALETGTEVRQ